MKEYVGRKLWVYLFSVYNVFIMYRVLNVKWESFKINFE